MGLYTVHLPVCAYVWQRDRLNAALSEVIAMSGHPQRIWESCKQILAFLSPLHLDINSFPEIAFLLCGEYEILIVRTKRIPIMNAGAELWRGCLAWDCTSDFLHIKFKDITKFLLGEIENGHVLALSTPLVKIRHHIGPLQMILSCTNSCFLPMD